MRSSRQLVVQSMRIRKHRWVRVPFFGGYWCYGFGLRADYNPMLCPGDCEWIQPFTFNSEWSDDDIQKFLNS